jgi:hypothetical protein
MQFRMANATEVEQRRDRFARNLQQLVEATELNLKQAAEEIGVPYPWMRRMVTAGTSRCDEKNRANLDRVAAYFLLPDTDHLWREQLVVELLTSPLGEEFMSRFKDSLRKLHTEESEKLQSVDLARLAALRKAFNFIDLPVPGFTNPRAVVMAFINDRKLSGLEAMAEEWLAGQVEHQVESAAPLRNGTDNGLCM